MSFKVKNTFTRTNANTPFHVSTVNDSFVQHIIGNYKNTGKLLDLVTEVSPDALTLTVTWVWNTEADYNEYAADSVTVAHRTDRDTYNSANGIALSQQLNAA